MFTVICNIVPTIGDIPKLVNVVKDALNNVIKFLVDLLVTVLSLDLRELQGILSRFLIKEINIFSNYYYFIWLLFKQKLQILDYIRKD